MTSKQVRQLSVVGIITLGLAVTTLSSLGASPAAAQGAGTRSPANTQGLVAQPSPTPVRASGLGFWCGPGMTPISTTQFCTDFKASQPHPDYR